MGTESKYSVAKHMRLNELVDYLLANPFADNLQLAAVTGWSPNYIQTVLSSDLFQSKLAERREELSPELSLTVKDHLRSVVLEATKTLQSRIPHMGDKDLLQAIDIAGRNMGLQSNASSAPSFTVKLSPQFVAAVSGRDNANTIDITPKE